MSRVGEYNFLSSPLYFSRLKRSIRHTPRIKSVFWGNKVLNVRQDEEKTMVFGSARDCVHETPDAKIDRAETLGPSQVHSDCPFLLSKEVEPLQIGFGHPKCVRRSISLAVQPGEPNELLVRYLLHLMTWYEQKTLFCERWFEVCAVLTLQNFGVLLYQCTREVSYWGCSRTMWYVLLRSRISGSLKSVRVRCLSF